MPGFVRTLMGGGFSAGQAAAANGYGILGQTATGSNQATAFALTTEFTEFTTVAASTGAVLPAPTSTTTPLVTGDSLVVVNNGANALAVYPPVGFSIGTAAANTALSLPANKTGVYIAKGNGNYWAVVSA